MGQDDPASSVALLPVFAGDLVNLGDAEANQGFVIVVVLNQPGLSDYHACPGLLHLRRYEAVSAHNRDGRWVDLYPIIQTIHWLQAISNTTLGEY